MQEPTCSTVQLIALFIFGKGSTRRNIAVRKEFASSSSLLVQPSDVEDDHRRLASNGILASILGYNVPSGLYFPFLSTLGFPTPMLCLVLSPVFILPLLC